MIPDDVISQIRDAADIIQVIGQHVQLRKAGRNWKGLCPFHGEKTPSFNVSPDKGFFHCFGCQKHGDVFTFVMELEGKSFVEAAEQLAGRFGIAVPRIEESPELRKARGERVAMLELNKLATTFYREVLADPKRGEAGRAYLAKRGVKDEIADRFQLGYAPSDWGALADYLKTQRADLELAVKVGLLAPRPKSGGYYDRNRDRLVCPVIVPGGDVVGFSSRVVGAAAPSPDGSEPPKYINSPESAVYKKSKLLFGLAQAREAMAVTKRVVLVEGNFDVITLHQAGFTDVVAPLGTALTPEQINVLKRMAERVVLLYDGDKAGYKATMHALGLCVEADVEIQVASRPGNAKSGGSGPLSGGMDPDSLVAGGGADQLREAIDHAKGGVEYFAFEVWSKARGNVDARSRALEDAARLVAKVANPMKRDLIVATLADGLDVDVGVVRNAIARVADHRPGLGREPMPSQRPAQYPNNSANAHPNAPGAGGGSGVGMAGAGDPQMAPAGSRLPSEEVEVISLLADHPSLIATPEADKAFWLLTDARLRDMYSAARAGQSLHELAAAAGQISPPIAVHVLSGKYADSKDPRGDLVAMTRNLEVRKSEVGLAELKKSLASAQKRGDRDMARRLAQLAEAERKGDRELVARIRSSLEIGLETGEAEISSNGKQVD
ncbi:MAG: DNA primase [Deltaproteobacteria bacterium]|nr:DNA primase [Deltaproteobacteria bacterium]MDQ3301275.1 DNA primase [Myxococcota bacterium]